MGSFPKTSLGTRRTGHYTDGLIALSLQLMELKERKRRAKRGRHILAVSRLCSQGSNYPKFILLMMILMYDVSFDMFESTEIEIDNTSGDIVDGENSIADDVAEILEQLQIDAGDEEAYINDIFGIERDSAETVERDKNIPNDPEISPIFLNNYDDCNTRALALEHM
jgi:hypothetical protein